VENTSPPKTILFICTGNIFRSLIAEYALRAALGPGPRYLVGSAGIEAIPQAMAPEVRALLLRRGIDPSGHRQRKLSAELLEAAHLPVAMGLDHREYVKRHFGRELVLFNQVCFGREEGLLDTWEAVPDFDRNPQGRLDYIAWVVDYLCSAMPEFIANMERYMGRRA
jgi:protein-tyrosine phosphatase